MDKYIGNELQIYGVEQMRLVGGKGDGMRIFSVRNGGGLEFTVSLDRCADISRLSLYGANYGYFAPCGYVSPKYYDGIDNGFLKSFTAGFFTTCGFNNVGSPCTDEGEDLPLHGSISNTPCDNAYHFIEDNKIHIKAHVADAALFGRNLSLDREYICPIGENVIYLHDTVTNLADKECPFEILYHCNMGYPLLTENAKVEIPSESITARNAHAQTGIDSCLKMEKPQKGYEEMCFYHKLSGKTSVKISNPDTGRSLEMCFDTAELPFFTEWKMMGEKQYVLGLEPGNCLPDGRDVMRQNGCLDILQPGEKREFEIKFVMK